MACVAESTRCSCVVLVLVCVPLKITAPGGGAHSSRRGRRARGCLPTPPSTSPTFNRPCWPHTCCTLGTWRCSRWACARSRVVLASTPAFGSRGRFTRPSRCRHVTLMFFCSRYYGAVLFCPRYGYAILHCLMRCRPRASGVLCSTFFLCGCRLADIVHAECSAFVRSCKVLHCLELRLKRLGMPSEKLHAVVCVDSSVFARFTLSSSQQFRVVRRLVTAAFFLLSSFQRTPHSPEVAS